VDAAGEKKAFDRTVLDVGEVIALTDLFVLVSASNPRQLETVTDEIRRQLDLGQGLRPQRTEGAADSGWVVLDYGEVVVHAFTEELRRFYELERLWGDVSASDIDPPGGDVAVSGGGPSQATPRR